MKASGRKTKGQAKIPIIALRELSLSRLGMNQPCMNKGGEKKGNLFFKKIYKLQRKLRMRL